MKDCDLVTADERGLRCARGSFHVDPWGATEQAVITHAHGDHLHAGSAVYHCSESAAPLVRARLPEGSRVVTHAWGEGFDLGDARVSLHPAGHIRGSAQVRIVVDGKVWVVTGDYKRAPDPTAEPFETLPCDGLVTEATFGLPVFRWEPPERVARDVLAMWDRNAAAGRATVLLCYALGKAQRILAELARLTDRAVWTHGAVETLTERYREAGVTMLPTRPVSETKRGHPFGGELVLAPPSARGTRWMKRFGDHEVAFASGWMRLRGPRRRRSLDRGFVMSDHADWPALLRTVRESGARRVLVTHGYAEPLARHLREQGLDAAAVRTRYEGEESAAEAGT